MCCRELLTSEAVLQLQPELFALRSQPVSELPPLLSSSGSCLLPCCMHMSLPHCRLGVRLGAGAQPAVQGGQGHPGAGAAAQAAVVVMSLMSFSFSPPISVPVNAGAAVTAGTAVECCL